MREGSNTRMGKRRLGEREREIETEQEMDEVKVEERQEQVCEWQGGRYPPLGLAGFVGDLLRPGRRRQGSTTPKTQNIYFALRTPKRREGRRTTTII